MIAPTPSSGAQPAGGDAPDMAKLRQREARAWAERQKWDPAYNEAFRWVMPFRRSSASRTTADLAHLLDPTAVTSTFNGAARLHQDIFPPGQPFFRLQSGPLPKMFEDGTAEGKAAREAFDRQLAAIGDLVAPFFATGEWDNAAAELFLDVYVGTGVMLILPGDDDRPVRFHTLPLEQYALEGGPFGDVTGLFWRVGMSRRNIRGAFPSGHFDDAFAKAEEEDPDGETELRQAFVFDLDKGGENGRWRFAAWLETQARDAVAVAHGRTRAKPFLSPRYWRLPGAVMGQGPALFATPIAKTLNRTMELTLKSAAISMSGIWGYRPGGTFNPDTARLAPGAMWPMQSTGGIMGPDVARLDVAAGKFDVSNIVLQELRTQLQQVLHDERLPEAGATPVSAAEVLARMSRLKQNHVGAFGRLVSEIVPVAVPRVVEILHDRKLLTGDRLKIDQLLVSLDVVSPIAQAMKAARHDPTMQAIQIEVAVGGQPARRFNLDAMLAELFADMGVPVKHLRDAQALAQFDAQAAQAAQAQAVMGAALNKPKDFAQALSPEQTAAGPPPA